MGEPEKVPEILALDSPLNSDVSGGRSEEVQRGFLDFRLLSVVLSVNVSEETQIFQT